MLKHSLPVTVKRDVSGKATLYLDKFGEEGPVKYNLYRGSKFGEGHADRILDHYLSCEKKGFHLKCSFSEDYRTFLRAKRVLGETSRPFSLRRRLLRTC